ncbi:metallophosphoesterase [Maricaulis sp.]|uniref:metallophosphoesterase n=1 Tax=Maricaulis sp. TaxID=1486257 RepID=UPI0025C3B1F0|nr:metallophosphoesterase [Maricaulis sp.]
MTVQLPSRLASLAAGLLVLTACYEAPDGRSITTELVANEEAPAQDAPHANAMLADNAAAPTPIATGTGGSFLALSDVHLLSTDTACPGHHCETSPSFWAETQTYVQTLVAAERPDFIIYLGDMPTHSSLPATVRDDIFAGVLNGLGNTAAGTEIPVLYLPGNNDTLGLNEDFYGLNDYCPFTEDDQTVFNAVDDPLRWPVLNGSADIVDGSHRADGYYAARVPIGDSGSHLRVLALNTNVYTSAYTLCSDLAVAVGSAQLDWLAEQLASARTAGEPALLAMHVPPGLDGYRGNGQSEPNTMWDPDMAYQGSNAGMQGRWMQDVMLEIIAAHEPGITGLVAGHTHLNGIRRLHSCDAASTVTELLVSVPGISTDHRNAPAFKHILLDGALEPVGASTHVATWNGSAPSWASPTIYDFATNYPNAAAPGATLLAQVNSIDDDERLQDMLRYLYAHETAGPPSGLTDPGFFREAMEVACSP